MEAIRVIESYWAIPGCSQVVLSTYAGETSPTICAAVSLVVENMDPGPDYFGATANPIKSNLSRLLKTSCEGFSKLTEEIAIKTRIEFSVGDPQLIYNLIETFTLESKKLRRIVVISEHMYPTGFRVKNPLYWCPDTFQLGLTSDLNAGWEYASKWWNSRGASIRKQMFSPFTPVQIANEQVIGIGLTHLQSGNADVNESSVRHRFSFNYRDAARSIRMQHRMLKLITFENLGLEVSERRLFSSSSGKAWQKQFEIFQGKSPVETQFEFVCRNFSSRVLTLFSWSQKALYFLAVWAKHRKYP